MLNEQEFQPTIDLTKEDEYPAFLTEENHDKLLSYLQYRLDDGNRIRGIRLARYAKIDRTISTWQKLSIDDSKRAMKQDSDGQAQAINVNLPLTHTHTEDMVAFFSAIFSPTAGDFLSVPDPQLAKQTKSLIDKLNGDAKACKYFKNLCAMLRSIFKYNIAGFCLEWEEAELNAVDQTGRNDVDSIDMYNFVWDTSIDDPSELACAGEWAAEFFHWNRKYIIDRDGDEFIGTSPVLDVQSNGNTAKYYKFPPNNARLSFEDDKTTQAGNMPWDLYGAALGADNNAPLGNAYEGVKMYCWLNPADFLLDSKSMADPQYTEKLELYKFTILGNTRIVQAEAVMLNDQPATDIPYYVGFLNQDDMGEAQRSQVELMTPFQTYGSFLVNADVAATRSNIWGIQGYDPAMFDLANLPPTSVAARVPSKIPGRDVRMGITNLTGQFDSSHTMEKLQNIMQLMQQFFPSQALPSQISQIDRAITSQVAAVMQGVSRRLHMLVRILDDDILNPLRMAEYRNLAAYKAVDLTGVTDIAARRILGSGLQQLNREAAGQAMQQLLFAIIQNPNSASQLDVVGLMDFWGSLLDMSIDLTKFRIQPPAVPGAPGAPAQTLAPGGPVAA